MAHTKPVVSGSKTNMNSNANSVVTNTNVPNVVTANTAKLNRNVNESKRVLPDVGASGDVSCASEPDTSIIDCPISAENHRSTARKHT